MIAASAFAAVSEVMLTHPIESAKVRLQTGRNLRNPRAWVWNGMGVRIAGILPVRIVFWSTMETSQKKFTPAGAGAIAGLAQSVVDTPVEAAKIARMTGGKVVWGKNLLRGFHWNVPRNMGFAAGVSVGRAEGSWWGPPVGAVMGAILTQPLDTLKSRTQAHRVHSGPIHLWAGLLPRCVVAFSTMFVGSAAFDLAQRFLR